MLHKNSSLLYCVLFIVCLSLLTINSFSQICTTSQYFNGQRCAPCKANCKCSSDNTCDNCLSGYAFDATFSNCLQCPTLADPVNIGCKQCCSQISGTSFVCSQCPVGDYIFNRGGQCIKSIGCLDLQTNGICNSCVTNYFLFQGKCNSCHASCDTCKDATLCLTCKIGYFNSTNIDYALCTACPAGCKSCTSLVLCTACNAGFYLSAGSCLACSSNCLSCTAVGCTQCDSVSTLIGTTCFLCTDNTKSGTLGCQTCQTVSLLISCTSCANSFYLGSGGQCIACTTTYPNSYLCSASAPIQCLNDYHSTLTTRNYLINSKCVSNTKSCKMMSTDTGLCSQCYFEGPDSYYRLAATGQCVKCQQAGCKSYTTTCQCLQCLDGYRYVNSLCVACQNLHCIKCQSDVQSCQKCSPYYGIFSSACISCLKTHCLNCDGDYTLCKTCQNGYYLNSGSCYLCQGNCLLCQSNTICTSCAVGYYLQSNGRCKVKPSHCLEVDSKYLGNQVATCKKCEYGYQIMFGNCYPCSQDLFNMNKCEKFCPSYYALHKDQGKLLAAVWGLVMVVAIFFA